MFTKVLAISALAAVASAQSSVLGFTSVPNPVTDGQAQAITYQTNDTVTPVTITLRQGVSNALNTIYNLTTSATGGAYIWTPATDLPNGNDYALQISQGTQVNYYGPFRVQGYQGPSSSNSSSSASASTSATTSDAGAAPIGTAGSISAGTGSALPRNTTFASATLTASSSGLTSAPASNSAGATTTSGAATSKATSSTSTTPTGAAVANFQVGSSLALIGAIAAMLMP